MVLLSSWRCFGLPWFWSSPSYVLSNFKGVAGTPKDIETASANPHCVFSNVGYRSNATRKKRRRWVYVRDASYRRTPLLFEAGGAETYDFPPCFVPSRARGATQDETYCFSPRVLPHDAPELRHERGRWDVHYERGVLLSWAGTLSNFGHMAFEQILRVHTLLSLDGADERHSDPQRTLIILLWGCDLSQEHGAPTTVQPHLAKGRAGRWQTAPRAFGASDGPSSNFWRWLRLFSSHAPVCLGNLPDRVRFTRLHVGDVHLDHFTSIGAKPTQYHRFARYVSHTTRRTCPQLSMPLSIGLSGAAGTAATPAGGTPTAGFTPAPARGALELARAKARMEAALQAARQDEPHEHAHERAERNAAARRSRPLPSAPLVLLIDKGPSGRRRPLNLPQAADHIQAHLHARRPPQARVEILHMSEAMPMCEQLRWLQAADVLVTPAGGISISTVFAKPGASILSFGVHAPVHQKAVGAWDYDMIRLQAFSHATRKVYAVLPSEVNTSAADCAFSDDNRR